MIPFAQRRLKPTVIAMYNYLQPVVATLVSVIIGMVLLDTVKVVSALFIFLAVWMTGGREMFEFSRRDWILFSIVAVIEAATLVGIFALGCRGGRRMLDLAYLRHRLQGAAIVTQVLPSACMKAVYTDLEFNGRLVVCGLPNDGSLYYIVQEFDDDFHLTTTETSRFFDNDSDLMEDLSADLIDITGYFF